MFLKAFLLAAVIKVEPYWNVNLVIRIKKSDVLLIKVEPYWNVNEDFDNTFRK